VTVSAATTFFAEIGAVALESTRTGRRAGGPIRGVVC
jgi:hypothetical protein